MGLFEQLPYVNFHEMNLAWILETVKKCENIMATYDGRLTDLENELASYIEFFDSRLMTILQEMIDNGDFDNIFQSVTSITDAEIDVIIGGVYNG